MYLSFDARYHHVNISVQNQLGVTIIWCCWSSDKWSSCWVTYAGVWYVTVYFILLLAPLTIPCCALSSTLACYNETEWLKPVFFLVHYRFFCWFQLDVYNIINSSKMLAKNLIWLQFNQWLLFNVDFSCVITFSLCFELSCFELYYYHHFHLNNYELELISDSLLLILSTVVDAILCLHCLQYSITTCLVTLIPMWV